MSSTDTRRFPLNKPDGFTPAIQRYSADHPVDAQSITVMLLGMQSHSEADDAFSHFRQQAQHLLTQDSAPATFDYACYRDPQGYTTQLVMAYWYDPAKHSNWQESKAVSSWWDGLTTHDSDIGYFREVFTSSIKNTETIAFKEFVRGLSACPASAVKPMGESGYWGAARDRIPASANDLLETNVPEPLARETERNTKGQRITVTPPKNLTLIRSGVSWADCGKEQLDSYMNNLKPVLDQGMEYLRQNPVGTGCCCMRQLDTITPENDSVKENYCAGYFLSLGHLEAWAHKHPTHLAIYGGAQKERIKYQENLQLRTYHEVYIIDQDAAFEYINCHNQTGLLPWF